MFWDPEHILFILFQFIWMEVERWCIEMDCPELFPSIVADNPCLNPFECDVDLPTLNPRSSQLQLHGVGNRDARIVIDRFCARQNTWTEFKALDLKTECFAMIYRNGQLIMIGGWDYGVLNTVITFRRPFKKPTIL